MRRKHTVVSAAAKCMHTTAIKFHMVKWESIAKISKTFFAFVAVTFTLFTFC